MDLSYSDGDPAFTGLVHAFLSPPSISPLACSLQGAVRASVPDEAGTGLAPYA